MSSLAWSPGHRTEVYTIDGHLVGTVTEGWPAEYTSSRTLARMLDETGRGYFLLSRPKGADLYVPLEAVSDFTRDRIRLRLTRKQLGAQGWDKRPTRLEQG